MVFEPNYSKVVSSVRKNIGTTQSSVEVKLPTGEFPASKIYSSGARVSLLSGSASGRDVAFGGVVDFQVVYDGGGFRSIDYTAEFKDKFFADQDVVGELVVQSNVIDVSSSIVAGEVKVVVIVETVIDVIENRQLNVLTAVSADKVYVSNKELEYYTYIGKVEEKFDVSGDERIENALSILSTTPNICLGKVVAKQNYLEVSGKLNLEVCYKNGEDLQNIASKSFVEEFTWEVAFDGVSNDDLVQSLVGVLSNEVKITSILEDGGVNIDYVVPIKFSCWAFSKKQISVIDDLYSENNYLSVTCENFDTTMKGNTVEFKDNIVGSSLISDDAPFIDEILGVCNTNTMLASSRIEDGRIFVEGVTIATVLYYTKETNEVTSVQVEMPFAVDERADASVASVVTICLSNVSARSRRGKEIEVSADLNVYADTYSFDQACAITNVVLGDEKEQDDCTLSIYIVKENQTLWDVAKENNVNPDLLLEQNPELELPIKAGDKIVLYKPSILKF